MYNKIILMGRLTNDPELRQTPNGVSVSTFSIAVDRPRSKTDTDFPTIVAWRQTAEFVCKYFKKGSPILVEGSLQSRSYTDKNGGNRTVWEVIADQARFTGSKEKSIDILPDETTYTTGAPEDFTELDDSGDLPF